MFSFVYLFLLSLYLFNFHLHHWFHNSYKLTYVNQLVYLFFYVSLSYFSFIYRSPYLFMFQLIFCHLFSLCIKPFIDFLPLMHLHLFFFCIRLIHVIDSCYCPRAVSLLLNAQLKVSTWPVNKWLRLLWISFLATRRKGDEFRGTTEGRSIERNCPLFGGE